MNYHVQQFLTPDGTEMVILPAAEFERLRDLAEDAEDIAAAESALAETEALGGPMPGEVLNAIMDDGLTPIAAWRRFRGMSQAELARRSGLSQVFVSKIERGENHGMPKSRKAIAEALDAPLWTLDTEFPDEDGEGATEADKDVLSDRILDAVRRRPGSTEREIAQSLFGPKGYQQQVNADCRLLTQRNVLRREGMGGRNDPYRYWAAEKKGANRCS